MVEFNLPTEKGWRNSATAKPELAYISGAMKIAELPRLLFAAMAFCKIRTGKEMQKNATVATVSA